MPSMESRSVMDCLFLTLLFARITLTGAPAIAPASLAVEVHMESFETSLSLHQLDGLIVAPAGAGGQAGAGGRPRSGDADGGGEGAGPLGSRAWYAWIARMPAGPPSLHVVGQVLAPAPSYDVRLTPSRPQGIDPAQLVLDASLAPRRKTGPGLPAWIEARYEQEPAGGYEEVVIRRDGRLCALVPIEKAD